MVSPFLGAGHAWVRRIKGIKTLSRKLLLWSYNYNCLIVGGNPLADPDQDPLSVTKVKMLRCPGPKFSHDFEQESYGKWMVFKDFRELNSTWCSIREKLRSGHLGAMGATCSTLKYNPLSSGAGPTTTGTIFVFTDSKKKMHIGMKLIKLPVVQQTIKFKTQEATQTMKNKHCRVPTNQPVASNTLFWNDGHPSEERNPRCSHMKRPQYNSSQDEWKINVVSGARQYKSETTHGKWVISSNFNISSKIHISRLWHTWKPKIEKGHIPAIKMVCPGPKDVAKIHVYTSEELMNEVGYEIIHSVQEDITYFIEVGGRSRRNDHVTLHWNAGKPDYDKA